MPAEGAKYTRLERSKLDSPHASGQEHSFLGLNVERTSDGRPAEDTSESGEESTSRLLNAKSNADQSGTLSDELGKSSEGEDTSAAVHCHGFERPEGNRSTSTVQCAGHGINFELTASKESLLGSRKQQRDARSRRKLRRAIFIASAAMLLELIGGWVAGSLALAADATHMLSDIAGYSVSLLSLQKAQQPPDAIYNFGFHRLPVLGALCSVVILWMATVALCTEAANRLIQGNDVDGKVMFILGSIGLALNLLLLYQFKDDAHLHGHGHGNDESLGEHGHSHGGEPEDQEKRDLNVSAAVIHVLGDILQSVGVCIAGALIWWKPEWRVADPICTFLFAILVVWTTKTIVRDIVDIFMERTPRHIKLHEVQNGLAAIPGVSGVHCLHVWSLAPKIVLLSVHLVVEEGADCEWILILAERECHKHDIYHTTIQLNEQHHCEVDMPGHECTPSGHARL
mmetsp:Transcript_7084/g.26056  ORF Transcript_7084/g.26056 Transcript_7084/m.26056 type:complete len:456 (+) Transcript_7084:40-1407(+)